MPSPLSISWSVDKFNSFLKGFAKQVKVDNEVVLRKFTIDLMRRVIFRTPVDTGRARAGWKAAGDALGIKIPVPKRRRPGEPAFDYGIYEELITPNQITIRIANNVEYIIPLEYGWSKQAPMGMLRLSMAELRSGNDLTTDLMDAYQESWGDLSGKQRYATQRKVLRGVLSDVQDRVVPTRRFRKAPPVRRK